MRISILPALLVAHVVRGAPLIGLQRPRQQLHSMPDILRLVGGAEENECHLTALTVRVRTPVGIKRVLMESSVNSLADLMQRLRRDHRIAANIVDLSRCPGGGKAFHEEDGKQTLQELQIAHGTMLYLASSTASTAPSHASTAASREPPTRTRRKRHTTMADFEAERGIDEPFIHPPLSGLLTCALCKCDRRYSTI